MISNYFINRPIFAGVLAIVIILMGGLSMYLLPIAQYPSISPPSVRVVAMYPGASAEIIAETVGTPIEEAVNGVEGMLYMSSTSNNDGLYNLIITFEVGTDVNMATTLVQNKVNQSLTKLPGTVQRLGVTTDKSSTNTVMIVALSSDDNSLSGDFLTNYASSFVVDELKRIQGISEIQVHGTSDYSMRVWLDPAKLKNRNLVPQDIINAISNQNVQVASGQLGKTPTEKDQQFQYSLIVKPGRMTSVEEFKNIIIKTTAKAQTVRLKDVAEIELGSKSYNVKTLQKGKQAVAIIVNQLSEANAIDISDAVKSKLKQLESKFPPGLTTTIAVDNTDFVKLSIKEVIKTLGSALVLVILVMFIFLQNWRTTLIPAITIPVSLIGTFAFLMAFGFSINLLTLFALVLAIGIVVDDAIIIVENTTRHLEDGQPIKEAVISAMKEVTGPILATTLVLMSVFLPAAMMSGITGELYRQFAVTIAISTFLSAINALTLSPTLCMLVLSGNTPSKNKFFTWFNKGLQKTTNSYERTLKLFLRKSAIIGALFLGIVIFSGWQFTKLPTGFFPQEDQGYFVVTVQLPEAASANRTQKINGEIDKALGTIEGITNWVSIIGYSVIDKTTASNQLTIFVTLDDWDKRLAKGLTVEKLEAELYQKTYQITDARIFVMSPPAIRGLGATGGFQMLVQDVTGSNFKKLADKTTAIIHQANANENLSRTNSTFKPHVPLLTIKIDMLKAKMMNLELQQIYSALSAYLGTKYVNDFSKWGKTFQVNLQSQSHYRKTVNDVRQIHVRNNNDQLVALGSVLDISKDVGPQIVTRYNLYTSTIINGKAAIGHSSGEAIKTMDIIAGKTLDNSMKADWTGMAYQEIKAGSDVLFIFLLAIVLVFLVLAAQYESWLDPFGVILAVPFGLFGAVIAISLRGLVNGIYMQIGIILLIGLASKNAIMIVEFIKLYVKKNIPLKDAVVNAGKVRLRPMMMTSLSFVFGVFPLVIATGVGANSRHLLGTTVFGGMITATTFTLLFIPVIYVILKKLFSRRKMKKVR